MVSVEEARRLVIENTPILKPVEVGLLDARGMVLAKTVVSDMNIPPLDNSAMDGFAVRAKDLENASTDAPGSLKIIGELAAGSVFNGKVRRGEAVRIMTGAPLPKGADTVVRQEDTQYRNENVKILVAPKLGDNVRYAGEDISKGAKVVEAGQVLTAARLGAIASSGPKKVKVFRRPVVAALATGNEVVDAGMKPGPGQIRSSNSYTMYHQAAEFGGVPMNLGIARDKKSDIAARIEKAIKKADILLTSGGISVGKFDFVGDALSDLGFRVIFYKVRQRPGQPLAFGKLGKTLVFAMPGNPVSSMICAIQYVRPAVRRMMGFSDFDLPEVEAKIEEDVKVKEGQTYFLRGVLSKKNGEYRVTSTGPQGSGILQSMASANSLIVVPPTNRGVRRGDKVRVQILEETPWQDLF